MESPSEDYVSLKALALELGLDRSNMRKYVLKSGLQPHRRRTPDSGGQLTLAITPDEANFVRQKRASEGYLNEASVSESNEGVFYVIQLVPELDPRRIKLGFADNLANRLSAHQTVAPTAKVLGAWACRRGWEATIMDALTTTHCRLVMNEVFECESPNDLLSYGDRLFDLLPSPNRNPSLSGYSPLLRGSELADGTSAESRTGD